VNLGWGCASIQRYPFVCSVLSETGVRDILTV
jgi:hypothetical protein